MSERLMISRCSEEPPNRCGFGSLRCGGEDGLLVGLHHGEPMVEILRVIGARRIADAKIGAQERCAKFRNLS